VVTVTSTVPVPAGATAVIDLDEFTVKLVALTDPNSTAVAPVRSTPEIVTGMPPASSPLAGLTPITVGGGETAAPPGRAARRNLPRPCVQRGAVGGAAPARSEPR